MNKIEELIAKMCPDGVEYKQLWQVTTWDKRFNGVDRAKQPAINPHHYYLAKELQPVLAEQGDIKVLTTSPTSLYTTDDLVDESHIKDGEIVAIPWGGNAVVQYYKGRYITSDNRIAVVNTESIMTKFLFYVLKSREEELSSYYRGAGIKHPEMSKVLGMETPIPPMEVQREIVRILDFFAELEAELEARKLQYAHYRDRLLSLESLEALDGRLVEMKRLGDVVKIKTGSKPSEILESGPFSYVNAGTTPSGFAESANTEEDTVTTPSRGQGGIGFVGYQPHPFWCGPLCYRIKAKTGGLLNKYLAYYLSSRADLIRNCMKEGGTPAVNRSDLLLIEIPVPSLATQRKVIDILDRFDTLTTSLTDGLPAEIEARHQQYEYHRDRLLDFPRKSGDAA